jgi:hypothetical protein
MRLFPMPGAGAILIFRFWKFPGSIHGVAAGEMVTHWGNAMLDVSPGTVAGVAGMTRII